MSQRDLIAELRAVRVAAPPEVRERVRLVAASAPTPPKRFTWRRALVVAVPVAAAIAASVVFTRPSGHQSATQTTVLETRVAHGAAFGTASSPKAFDALTVPSAKQRVQVVGTTLSLRTHDVSGGVKRAVAIVTSLSGYAVSVHADLRHADLTLKVPRTHVQAALTRLSKLGTITAEQLDITDKQAGLNATDGTIAHLQKLLASETDATKRAALTARIERLQRAEAVTRRKAHFATIDLHLATPVAVVKHHGHGPLHGVGVALRWLGIGAVYAVAIGTPVVVLLALVWLAVRQVRRRREDALLSSR